MKYSASIFTGFNQRISCKDLLVEDPAKKMLLIYAFINLSCHGPSFFSGLFCCCFPSLLTVRAESGSGPHLRTHLCRSTHLPSIADDYSGAT